MKNLEQNTDYRRKMNDEPEKKDSLKRQSAWLLFAKTAGFGFAFILPLIITRVLSLEKVGVYRQSFQVIMNAISILSFGVAMSAFYYLSRETEKRAAAIFNILLFHFITGGIAFFTLFFFPNILGNLFQSAEMTALAPAIGVVIWIWIFSMFLETVAIANQESVLATVFIIFAQFSKTALMVSAVVFYDTVESIIYAAIVQGVIQTVILLVYLNVRFPRYWTTFSFKFLREHLAYALPFGFAGILWVMQNDIHTYFVGYRFSDAEYAIYAYGCFQVPLIMMLAESVTSVLIPRMSELQLKNDRPEMIRLTARAMQKLSFFYFPIFIFLMITAQTFVITLFTRNYAASAAIFKINLILLPFHILVSDPIVRSYKEFGRFLVILRICMFIVLFSALYFGINHFGLTGIIAIAVASKIVEGLIAEAVVFYKIGAKFSDIYLLKNIGKTAIISIISGAVTFAVYYLIKDFAFGVGENIVRAVFAEPKINIIDFVSGGLTLAVSFAVFAPIYLYLSNLWGVFEDSEKQQVRNILAKVGSFLPKNLRDKIIVETSKNQPLTNDL